MLRNDKYLGSYYSGEELVENLYPRIVSDETYEKVRKIIDSNKHGKKSYEITYLLKNKIKCGYCGESVIGENGTSKNGERKFYYKCRGKKALQNAKPFLVYILFVSIIIVFIICLIPIIKSSISNIWSQLERYKNVTDGFLKPETINTIMSKINPQIYINSAKGTVYVLINIVMSLVILIYVLLEHKSLKRSFINMLDFLFGEEKAEKSLYYISKTNTIFSKYFYSKFFPFIFFSLFFNVPVSIH